MHTSNNSCLLNVLVVTVSHMLPIVKQTLTCQHPHSRFSRSFLLTLAIGMTFGFSFAYLLLTVVSWEKVDFLSNTLFIPQQNLLAHEHYEHDPHDHNDLILVSAPSKPVSFHSPDETYHKGKKMKG